MEKFISQDLCTGGRLKHFGCVFWTICEIGKKAIGNSKSVHFTFNRFFRVRQRGLHEHTYDPDAVARFNLHSCEYMWITWCIVYCADTANASPTSRTHARIDYNGFALAFNSDQYIIYTLYKYKFVRLHVLNFDFFNTYIWLYIIFVQAYSHILCTQCSFSASAYPFCHIWCCY